MGVAAWNAGSPTWAMVCISGAHFSVKYISFCVCDRITLPVFSICAIFLFHYLKPDAMKYMPTCTDFVLHKNIFLWQTHSATKLKIKDTSESAPPQAN